jgi:hypothetical protein
VRFSIELPPMLYDINGFDIVNRLSGLPKQMHKLNNYCFRKYLLAFENGLAGSLSFLCNWPVYQFPRCLFQSRKLYD